MTPTQMLIVFLLDIQTFSPVEQLKTMVGLVAFLGASALWAWRTGRRRVAKVLELHSELEQAIEDSKNVIGNIKREMDGSRSLLDVLEARAPSAMLAQAAANEQQAAIILRDLYDELAPIVAESCRKLAEVELALAVDPGDLPHLDRAERLAHTAGLLDPDENNVMRSLLAEMYAVRAVWKDDDRSTTASDACWNTAFNYMGQGCFGGPVPLISRLSKLGSQRIQDCHYAVAAVLLRRALVLSRRTFGPEHENTAAAWSALAGALCYVGRADEAESILRRVAPLLDKAFGPEHRSTLTARNNIASALQILHRAGEAEPIYRGVLAISERVFGSEDLDTLNTRQNLAGCLCDLGRYGEAHSVYCDVLKILEQRFGHEHRYTLTTRRNLAVALRALDRAGEAAAILSEVLAQQEKFLGPEHEDTVRSRRSLSRTFDVLGAHSVRREEEASP